MPNFYWKGVDLDGIFHFGNINVQSQSNLKEELLQNGIALSESKVILPLFARFISASVITDFFKNLSVLLEAGILVPRALALLEKQIKNSSFAFVVKNIIADVKTGTPLYFALNVYPEIFNSFVVQIVRAGEESGNMCKALQSLCQYRQAIEKFYRDLRSAALLPTIALSVFVVVATIIFTVVVPLFATIFVSAHKEIPAPTRAILKISSFLTGPNFIWFLFSVFFVCVAFWFILQQRKIRFFLDRIILSIPIVSTIIKANFRVTFLNSLSLLVGSGVSVVQALRIAVDVIDNRSIRKQLYKVTDSVAAGSLPAQELEKCRYNLFPEEIVALVLVGQESGRFPALLLQAAELAQSQIRRYLVLCTTLFQPIFVLVLGFLIVLLICAVYLPIFNLSEVII